MKLHRILLIPLLFSCFSLSSCGLKKYSLTITGETYLIKNGPYLSTSKNKRTRHRFGEGDLVIFETCYVYDADVVVRLNGEKLEYYDYTNNIEYRFSMPAKDSELNISIEGGI